MRTILDITLYLAGFATCWFCRDSILRLVSAASVLIKSLEDKLAALREKT